MKEASFCDLDIWSRYWTLYPELPMQRYHSKGGIVFSSVRVFVCCHDNS